MSGLTNITKIAALDAITIALNITKAEHAAYLGPQYPLSNLLNHKRDQTPMLAPEKTAPPSIDGGMAGITATYVIMMLFVIVVVGWACVDKMKRAGDSVEMKALWEELSAKDD
jgi:hypothetical protein